MAPAVLDAETPGRTATGHDKAASAERRQLTIASCELLRGAAAMDPEDLPEIIQSYHSCVVETIGRHNELVAHTYGNTDVVCFGYPEAHEDDPERAVRAALELVAAVAALKTPAPLQTRVGIATGLVVVSDIAEEGAHQCGIIGDPPNLAARLQAIAKPGSVIIAENTRKLLGNLFELEDLGTKDMPGFAGPMHAWRALRPSPAASRFEAFHATGLTALVGREEELELLLRRWSKAKAGEGQVVLLCGEAGIGKSRLTAALLEAIATEPHTRLRNFCSPQHTDSALYPTIGQIERAAGFTRDDTLRAKLDKLDAVLAQSSTSAQDAALLAEMLSLPNDRRYPVLELTPQQRRQRTLEALILQVTTLSHQNPVLMIFEDAQWIDPTSLELFSRTVDRISTLRALLIITYRPEFQPPWLGRPYVTALTINRLTEREAGAMIDRIVGAKPLPANIRRGIIERSDGIPLFVEEMTKAVLEAESQSAPELATAPALAVPATLHASLMARLDRLGAPAKELTQVGAAIGREFSHALLAAVVDKPEAELQAALDRIVAAGLLFGQGVAPYATYLFKHALIQDAAYDTLLREPRRALHAHIADTLERQFADIAENRPEILARHCAEAGLKEKAASLWGRAGQRSLERSALVEAVEQFTRGLDQIATLPGTPALRTQQIKLQVGLANALYHTKGFSAVETRAAFDQSRAMIERAEALGEHFEDPLVLYSILYGFFIAKFIPFDGEAACALASQFLELAEQQKATAPTMIGHRLLGTTLFCLGEPAEGLKHLDQASALYQPAAHRSLTTHFGHDVGAATLSLRSWAMWMLGYPETALAEIDHAINAARETSHAPTLMFALGMTSFTQICCRNYAPANAQIDECMALAEEKGTLHWKMQAIAHRGCVLALVGKSAEAIQTISSGIDGWRSIGATVFAPFWSSHLALAYADLGKFDDAWRNLGETMTAIETSKEKWCEAEINRVAGEIALRPPARDAARAQGYFERALSIARVQQAKSWGLRAAMSAARLSRDQGKPQQARELLAPAYSWFTEGFDTLDLKEAKTLLDALQ